MARELQLAGRMRGALRALMPAALKITQRYGGDFEPLERGGLCARCWRDWPDDPDFIPRWQRLMARNPAAAVFSGPVWQCAVVDEFVPAGKFRLITVDRAGELLAAIPLSLNSASFLETPGRGVTDYLDPLIDANAADDCWAIILELLNDLWDWSVTGLRIQLARGDSPARHILKTIAPKLGFEFLEKRVGTAPYISLPGTWDEYLASLDGHERKEIKRKIRNAQTKGNLRWQTLSRPDESMPALERAMSAMRQAEPYKADFTDEVLIEFLRRVCPQLSQHGDFYVQELWIEEKPTAWLLCLPSDQGPMIYNTSYDFSQKHWSPGIVSFSLSIQDAIAAGKPMFNLLRGGEGYKKRLGAKDLEMFRITLLPS
ncbi:MAG TPA: GNAT family N-acetyltransferase [Tepidisphaeraceae bacterium]|nr:GNAT family N-acetyltransferase [Tepidisphaeraceae bacterium]